LLSEPAIVARLAHSTLGSRSAVDWLSLAANYDRIRDEIEQVIPGFENYNRRVRQESGFYLPNAARDGVFNTADRKAHFTVHALSGQQFRDHEFLLTTIRSHDQFNTTIYGLNDRYRGIAGGRRVVFLNEQDMKENGWSKGQLLNLTSHYDGGTRIAEKFAAVPYNIPRRCAAAYFPETNVLVPIGSTADVSNTPASKSVPISIAPSA
jgi:anaerobic selenocysteine-containing dehydrogenase